MVNNPKRKKAWRYYLKNKGKVTLKAIAIKFGVSESTIRRWKKEDRWDDEQTPNAKKKKIVSNVHGKTIKYELILSDGLNDRQLLFCMYYVKYWNATKAYQQAYQCDYRTAHSNAHRLMANEGIKEEIMSLKKQLAESVMLDARQVLQKYIDIAFADITDFVEFGTKEFEEPVIADDGTVVLDAEGNVLTIPMSRQYVHLRNSSEVDGTIISSVKRGKDGMSVALPDKLAALAMLSKYTDLLDENQLKRLREEKLKADIKVSEGKAW